MSEHTTTTKRKRRGGLRGIIASAVSLCVLIGLALLLLPGGPGPGIAGIGRWLSGRSAGSLEGEFYFMQGMNRIFADLGDSVAAIGELGIQVLGSENEERYRDQARFYSPAVDISSGRAIVYDIGGVAVRIIDSGGVLAAFNTEAPIVSASINEKGWYCLTTQAPDEFKSVVTVYSDKHRERYEIKIASGYVLDARIGRDNKTIAVLSITDTGGRVSFYNRESENVQALYELAGEVILAIDLLSDGRVSAVTPTSVLVINKNGQGEKVYDFAGKQLGGMCLTGGDFIALYLLDYGIGSEGRLVTLGNDGSILGMVKTYGENKAMSLSGGVLAVLWDRGISLYDRELIETPYPDEGAGYSGVLALSGGKALAVSARESTVIG